MNSDIKNLSTMFAISALGYMFLFCNQIFAAQLLTISEFGNFTSALAIITVMSPLASIGINPTLIKLLNERKASTDFRLGPVLPILISSNSLCLLLLFAGASLLLDSIDDLYLFLMLSPLILSYSVIEVASAKFQIKAKYFLLTIWQNSLHFLRALFLIIFYFLIVSEITIWEISVIYSLSSITIFFLGTWICLPWFRRRFMLGKTPIGEEKTTYHKWIHILKFSTPFFLQSMTYLVFMNIGLILMRLFTDPQATGIYSAAWTLTMPLFAITAIVYQKYLLPKYFHLATHDPTKLINTFQKFNGYMLVFGVILVCLLYFLAPFIITIFFDDQYSEAIFVFQILLFAIPIRFIAVNSELVLNANDHANTANFGMMFSLITIAILSCVLVPAYSFTGAAVSYLIGEFVLLVIYFFVTYQNLYGKLIFFGWWKGFARSK